MAKVGDETSPARHAGPLAGAAGEDGLAGPEVADQRHAVARLRARAPSGGRAGRWPARRARVQPAAPRRDPARLTGPTSPRPGRWPRRDRRPGGRAGRAAPAARSPAAPWTQAAARAASKGGEPPGQERRGEAGQHVAGAAGRQAGVAGRDDGRRPARRRHHRAGALQHHHRAPGLRLGRRQPDPVGLDLGDGEAAEPGHLAGVRGQDDRRRQPPAAPTGSAAEGVEGVGVEHRRPGRARQELAAGARRSRRRAGCRARPAAASRRGPPRGAPGGRRPRAARCRRGRPRRRERRGSSPPAAPPARAPSTSGRRRQRDQAGAAAQRPEQREVGRAGLAGRAGHHQEPPGVALVRRRARAAAPGARASASSRSSRRPAPSPPPRRGRPMSATVTSPARAGPGWSTRPRFWRPKVTVRSASTQGPSGRPPSAEQAGGHVHRQHPARRPRGPRRCARWPGEGPLGRGRERPVPRSGVDHHVARPRRGAARPGGRAAQGTPPSRARAAPPPPRRR